MKNFNTTLTEANNLLNLYAQKANAPQIAREEARAKKIMEAKTFILEVYYKSDFKMFGNFEEIELEGLENLKEITQLYSKNKGVRKLVMRTSESYGYIKIQGYNF